MGIYMVKKTKLYQTHSNNKLPHDNKFAEQKKVFPPIQIN
jgi:hypothetical protein